MRLCFFMLGGDLYLCDANPCPPTHLCCIVYNVLHFCALFLLIPCQAADFCSLTGDCERCSRWDGRFGYQKLMDDEVYRRLDNCKTSNNRKMWAYLVALSRMSPTSGWQFPFKNGIKRYQKSQKMHSYLLHACVRCPAQLLN